MVNRFIIPPCLSLCQNPARREGGEDCKRLDWFLCLKPCPKNWTAAEPEGQGFLRLPLMTTRRRESAPAGRPALMSASVNTDITISLSDDRL